VVVDGGPPGGLDLAEGALEGGVVLAEGGGRDQPVGEEGHHRLVVGARALDERPDAGEGGLQRRALHALGGVEQQDGADGQVAAAEGGDRLAVAVVVDDLEVVLAQPLDGLARARHADEELLQADVERHVRGDAGGAQLRLAAAAEHVDAHGADEVPDVGLPEVEAELPGGRGHPPRALAVDVVVDVLQRHRPLDPHRQVDLAERRRARGGAHQLDVHASRRLRGRRRGGRRCGGRRRGGHDRAEQQ
jgi:hypothetical protein